MPSFVCDHCQETLKKAKLDQHAQRCRMAVFSCIDCYKTFKGVEHRDHFSCITEVQKYHQKTQSTPIMVKKENISIKEPAPAPAPETAPAKELPIKQLIKDLKAILKNGPDASLKVIKKQLKKSSSSRKLLQKHIIFSLNKSTNEITLKLE